MTRYKVTADKPKVQVTRLYATGKPLQTKRRFLAKCDRATVNDLPLMLIGKPHLFLRTIGRIGHLRIKFPVWRALCAVIQPEAPHNA